MRKLLVHWDETLDSGFRSRLERALDELQVVWADAQVNQDPDPAFTAHLALAAASSKPSLPRTRDTLLVLAGPGPFPEGASGLRLEASDIDGRTRRWIAVTEKLGPLVGKSALAGIVAAGDDADALRQKLDKAEARASELERAAASLELERNTAVRAQKHAEASLASERANTQFLAQEVARLTDVAESSVYALSEIPPNRRFAVESARIHARRARLSAARASEAASLHPDALIWPKAHATYSGETRNGLPNGHGVITFRSGDDIVASYGGQFLDGLRTDHGVAISDGGHVWSGEWRNGEACGFGLLETPDGRRFEGKVAPGEDGSPQKVEPEGWTWLAEAMTRISPAKVHEPVLPLLASPPTRPRG